MDKKVSLGIYIPVNSGKGLPSTTKVSSEFVFWVAGVILFIFLIIPLCSITYEPYFNVKFLNLLLVFSVGSIVTGKQILN